jgi:hypothetical protein
MGDLVVLFVILVLPAAVVLGPLAIFTLGLAAVADLDGNGLVRSQPLPFRRSQPAPGSLSSGVVSDSSVTIGPASRMSSVTPSA